MSILDVQAFRDCLVKGGMAPKTINRRISSLSSFFKYLGGAAAEMRLPITVPNPAHAQFISRESTDARDETRALSATRARQLMGLPQGDSLIAYRDRAILKLYLYSGIRLAAAGSMLRIFTRTAMKQHCACRRKAISAAPLVYILPPHRHFRNTSTMPG
jgi:site-specific recombinase XerC